MVKNGISDYGNRLISLAREKGFPHAVIIEDCSLGRAMDLVKLLTKIILCDSDEEKPCEKCGNCIKVNSD
ncbi:MAG: hypothetical protein IKE41_01215, partial [Clostridia bacterium]|nr:hypothetical protein [Clostridia bacterium]